MTAADELNRYCLSPAIIGDLREMMKRIGRTNSDLADASVRITVYGTGRMIAQVHFSDGQEFRAELTPDGWTHKRNVTAAGSMNVGDRQP